MAALDALGCQVTLDRAATRRWRRFAGTDEERAGAFARAAAHRGSGTVMITRGGYGLSRILARIDYAAVAASGKRFIGNSDFTAFNAALYARCRVPSWQGPSLGEDFGRDDGDGPDPFMLQGLGATLVGRARSYRLEGVVRGSVALPAGTTLRGRLWGGNLAMLASLCGAPLMPAIRDGLLFLEDIGEAPYRVERMLLQLAASGIVQRQRAVLLGRFTRGPADERDVDEHAELFDYRLADVFETFARAAGVPVLRGLPFGHVRAKATLPFGVPVQLERAVRAIHLRVPAG